MSLTFGRGPFGRQPGGEFNFTRQGPDVVLYWEGFPKRVRVEFNGVTVADSRRVKALHETGKFLVLYFRRQDADMERLEPSDHRTDCPHKGTASYWTVRVGDRIAENAVWSYENPVASAPFIASHLAFDFAKMDAWYQEDERVYAHPRDPYHRFDVHRSSRHVVVRHGGVVIAESDKPRILFETGTAARYYLPPEDVRTELLNQSETVSQCPYKGDGQHWNLALEGSGVQDAAWTLPNPLGEADVLTGFFCFYPTKVEVEADGERLVE